MPGVARKLLKRSYHTLRELGEDALTPASAAVVRAQPSSHRCAAAGSSAGSRRHVRVDGLERPSGRNASPSGSPYHHVTGPSQPEGRGPSKARSHMAYRLGVDVGGTFTDLFLVDDGDHRQWRVKTPSTPSDPRRACSPAWRGSATRRGSTPADLGNVVHGTTVATNAVLESKGARVGLITTQGFGQILHLARSQTPGPLAGWIIMVKPDPPASLADTREAVERMDARGNTLVAGRPRAGRRAIIEDLVDSGVESLTISLINSYVDGAPRAARSPTSSSGCTRASRSRSPPPCCRSSASTSGR